MNIEITKELFELIINSSESDSYVSSEMLEYCDIEYYNVLGVNLQRVDGRFIKTSQYYIQDINS